MLSGSQQSTTLRHVAAGARLLGPTAANGDACCRHALRVACEPIRYRGVPTVNLSSPQRCLPSSPHSIEVNVRGVTLRWSVHLLV